jgi:hypothetical protein
MTDLHSWGVLPRGDTVGTPDAVGHIDALLAHAACRHRPVQYALDQDPSPLSREEVVAWLTSAEAEGLTRVRYIVDARGDGPVHVSLRAIGPMEPDTPG